MDPFETDLNIPEEADPIAGAATEDAPDGPAESLPEGPAEETVFEPAAEETGAPQEEPAKEPLPEPEPCPESEQKQEPAAEEETVYAPAPEAVREAIREIREGDPAVIKLLGLNTACNEARRALDPRVAAGDKTAAGEKHGIDTELKELLFERIASGTVGPEAYSSIAAAVNARAGQLGTLELVTGVLPLILEEGERRAVLESALSYCRALGKMTLPYLDDGKKKKLVPDDIYLHWVEKTRLALADQYNHLPTRQNTRDELQSALRTAQNDRKEAKKRLKSEKANYRAAKRTFFRDRPDVRLQYKNVRLKSWIFVVPGLLALIAALIYTRFKPVAHALPAAAGLFVLLLIAQHLYLSLKKKSMMKIPSAGELLSAKAARDGAESWLKKAERAVKSAKKSIDVFNKTDIK